MSFTGNMDGNIYINNNIMGLVQIVGFLTGIVVGRMKRKSVFLTASLTSAVCLSLVCLIPGTDILDSVYHSFNHPSHN